jgi:hypothetical protein
MTMKPDRSRCSARRRATIAASGLTGGAASGSSSIVRRSTALRRYTAGRELFRRDPEAGGQRRAAREGQNRR